HPRPVTGRPDAGGAVRRVPGRPGTRRRAGHGAVRAAVRRGQRGRRRPRRGGGDPDRGDRRMRPVRLDMHGFAAFREPTTVDFTDADYFALVGPTGSGKSTVLDAICFALYGTVPRWRHSGSVAHALA